MASEGTGNKTSMPEFENFNGSPFHIKLGSKKLYSTGPNQNKSLWAENENTLTSQPHHSEKEQTKPPRNPNSSLPPTHTCTFACYVVRAGLEPVILVYTKVTGMNHHSQL